jgi:hypothetical protein
LATLTVHLASLQQNAMDTRWYDLSDHGGTRKHPHGGQVLLAIEWRPFSIFVSEHQTKSSPAVVPPQPVSPPYRPPPEPPLPVYKPPPVPALSRHNPTQVRARGVTLRARGVTLRARWVTLRARWVTLRAR